MTIQVLTRYILELNFHKKLEWRACLVLKKNVDILRNKGLRCHFTIIYTGSLMFSYIIKLKRNTYFYLKLLIHQYCLTGYFIYFVIIKRQKFYSYFLSFKYLSEISITFWNNLFLLLACLSVREEFHFSVANEDEWQIVMFIWIFMEHNKNPWSSWT